MHVHRHQPDGGGLHRVGHLDFLVVQLGAVGGVASPVSYTISWNNGQTSTMSLTMTDVIIAGTEQVTGVGTITAGEFTGGAVTVVIVYPTLNPLLCLTSGVTSVTGTVILQITVAP